MQQATQARQQKYTPYTGPRDYVHVSPERRCRICGKDDWCSYTRNEEVSFCARITAGANAISKKDRWGIFFHTDRNATTQNLPQKKRRIPAAPKVDLAPLEIRHAVYTELLKLSPATNYKKELIESPGGLASRGFPECDFNRFGALPPTIAERSHLARELRLFVLSNFRQYAEKLSLCAVLGIPGFWQENTGAVQLWMRYDENAPLLVIPYRNSEGYIQACQVRRTGKLQEGQKPYSWLATPKLRFGVSSGTPIHHTFLRHTCTDNEPILITEGALKAEAFFALRPLAKVVATSGVSCSHDELIGATRGRRAFIGFDADHRENKAVCRQLGRLIAGREQDTALRRLETDTKIIIWERSLGIKDKGIDDAALLDIPMRSIGIRDWYDSLTGEPKEEVDMVWKDMNFRPA
jgi:hypothetical protein